MRIIRAYTRLLLAINVQFGLGRARSIVWHRFKLLDLQPKPVGVELVLNV